MMKYDINRLKEIQRMLDRREEKNLFDLAAKSSTARRRVPDPVLQEGYRQNFSVDVDRILHSRAYTRYIDKTQVFYLIENDHITHRVLHVQLVSKIARSMGRFLGLNEDLIEAISLGHDIGHAPFGHDGERCLSLLCKRHNIGYFLHNVQSVRFLDRLERKGLGWNLCLETLDGILCHDGEIHNQRLVPDREKDFSDHEAEKIRKTEDPQFNLVPMTLEGCVVRMADTISYIGRDIEDAIRLKMIDRSEIPKESSMVLGDTNGTIVFRLVTDIIINSYGKEYIAFSPEVSEALRRLKEFNMERIYLNPAIKTHLETINILFEHLFERYLEDIARKNMDSVIFKSFLSDMSEDYLASHCPEEIVRDFIAGMTDQYFLRQCPEEIRPASRVV